MLPAHWGQSCRTHHHYAPLGVTFTLLIDSLTLPECLFITFRVFSSSKYQSWTGVVSRSINED